MTDPHICHLLLVLVLVNDPMFLMSVLVNHLASNMAIYSFGSHLF